MEEVVLSDKMKKVKDKIEDKINNLSEENIDEFLESDLIQKITELIKGDKIEHSKKYELLEQIVIVANATDSNSEFNRSLGVREKLWKYLENELKIKSDFFIDLDIIHDSGHLCHFYRTKMKERENIPKFNPIRKIDVKNKSWSGEIKVESSNEKIKEDFKQIVEEVRNNRFPESDLIEKIPVKLTPLEEKDGAWHPPKPSQESDSSVSINLDIMEEDIPENVKRIRLKNTLTHEYSHALIELDREKYDLYRGLSPSEWKNLTEILADLVTVLKGGIHDFRRKKKAKEGSLEENSFSYYTPKKFRLTYEEVILEKEGFETLRNIMRSSKKINLLSIVERDWSILTRGWDYNDPEIPITSDEDIWEILKENYKETYLWKYFGEITKSKREEYFESLREDKEISELKEELTKTELRDRWEDCYDFALDFEDYNEFLEEGVIHKKMIEAFENNGSELPEDAILSKEIIGWVVKVDDSERHWIEDVNDELKVYTKFKKWENMVSEDTTTHR